MDGFFGLVLLGMVPWVLFGGGILYLGLRYVRGTERRRVGQESSEASERRIVELEDTVAQLASEMSRLADGQHFTAQLLAGKEEGNR